jgi:hypothetical protein
MPRNFFHVFDDSDFIKDVSGTELSGIAEARSQLTRAVAQVPEKLRRPGTRVAVHDDAGNMLDEAWVLPPK